MSDRPDWSAPDEPSGQQQPGPEPGQPPVPPGWSPQQPPPSGGWGGGTPSGGWGGGGTPSGGWGTGTPPGGAGSTGWGRAEWGADARGGYGRPGVVPLRPLSVGELLDGSVSAIRFSPKAMLGLSAVVAAVSQVVQVLLTYSLLGDFFTTYQRYLDSGAGPATVDELSAAAGRAMVAVAATAVLSAVAMLLLTGVLTVIVSRAVLGQRIGVGEAWAVLRPSVWRLLGVTAVLGLGAIALVVVAMLPALGNGSGGLVLLLLPLALLAIVFLGVRLCLATTVVVLERAAVGVALRRSWRLVGGAWWRTLGVLVLAAVITLIVGRIFEVPFSLLAGGDVTGTGGTSVALWPLLITSIGAIVGAAITWPFAAGVTVLLYVDRRMRREGLDLELARAAGLAPGGTGHPTT